MLKLLIFWIELCEKIQACLIQISLKFLAEKCIVKAKFGSLDASELILNGKKILLPSTLIRRLYLYEIVQSVEIDGKEVEFDISITSSFEDPCAMMLGDSFTYKTCYLMIENIQYIVRLSCLGHVYDDQEREFEHWIGSYSRHDGTCYKLIEANIYQET